MQIVEKEASKKARRIKEYRWMDKREEKKSRQHKIMHNLYTKYNILSFVKNFRDSLWSVLSRGMR